jgi:hypothetical protein
LNYFGEKKLLVGRIRFSENKDNNAEKNKNDADSKLANKNPKIVPIYLSEKNLKILNKTFMH